MPEPTDELIAALTARIDTALSAQSLNTQRVVDDASAIQRTAGTRTQRFMYGSLGGIGALMMTVTGWIMDKAEELDSIRSDQVVIIQKLESIERRCGPERYFDDRGGRRGPQSHVTPPRSPEPPPHSHDPP